MEIQLPFTPTHSKDWLEAYFKENYYKKPYDRFNWWRTFTIKNKPLSTKHPLRDKILNGDFDLGPYKFEAEIVEHIINKKYLEVYPDQGRFVEETSLDRARRKRLLKDYEDDENKKLSSLISEFKILIGLKEEEIENELSQFDSTLIEFYYYLTEKYPRKNRISY